MRHEREIIGNQAVQTSKNVAIEMWEHVNFKFVENYICGTRDVIVYS